jgi:hypothetical protein
MMAKLRCKHRLPSPDIAGAQTWDLLKGWSAQFPHLRPCPKRKDLSGGWNWIYKKLCEKCSAAERDAGAENKSQDENFSAGCA